MGCEQEEQLEALASGQLEGERAAEVRRHASTCVTCSARLTEIHSRRARSTAVATVELHGKLPAPTTQSYLHTGDTVGRYIVLRHLGEGGMGVVYAAVDPDLDRKVALKLLHPGPSSSTATQGQNRLLREAQAMAKLHHPFVAAVYDVGTFGDGVFLAMELVDGLNLRAWLKEAPRSWRDVLRALIDAARGLAAAHSAGLVHRDIKPDNILVSADGRAKITDFGLARSAELAPERVGAVPAASKELLQSVLTEAGQFLGTPSYMAPEHLREGKADALADQFSFCATAYEALFRQRPFSVEERARLGSGEQVPARTPPPGSRVPRWLQRAIFKGLSFEPGSRHSSMETLIGALEADPWAARRRWAAAAAALGVAVAAAVGVSRFATRESRLCEGGRARLAGVWDDQGKRAVQDAFRATGKGFADDSWRATERLLDDYAAHWLQMARQACVATRIHGEQSEAVLTARTGCLERRAQELQALTDVLRRADPSVVSKAPQAAATLSDLRPCADIEALLAQVKPPSDPALKAAVDAAGKQVAGAKALLASGQISQALAQARSASEAALPTGYAPLQAEALDLLGWVQVRSGDAKSAAPTLYEAEWKGEAGHADAVAVEAAARNVYTLARLARYDEAERESKHAEALLRRTGGDTRLESELLFQDATSKLYQGQYADALERLTRAAALREQSGGPDSLGLATVLDRLSSAAERTGKLDQAMAAATRALQIRERALGSSHPELADSLITIGGVQREVGQRAEASQSFQRALEIRQRAFDPESPDVATAWFALADSAIDENRYRFALDAVERAEHAFEKTYGIWHPSVGNSLANIGVCVESLGCAEEALTYYQRSREILEKVNGVDHPSLYFIFELLADAYQDLGRLEESAAAARRALAIAASQGPQWPDAANGLDTLAVTLVLQGKLAEARQTVDRAIALDQSVRPADAMRRVDDLSTLSEVLLAQREFGEAAKASEEALRLSTGRAPPFHTRVLQALRRNGQAHVGLGDLEGGVATLERAARDAGEPDASPWDAARIRFALAQALWTKQAEHARALELAAQARDALTGLHSAVEAARASAWIAAHRR